MNRLFSQILTLVVVMTSAALLSAQPAWQIDKAHSRIGFEVTHLGINTVQGHFKQYDAVVEADDAGKLTKVSAKVNAGSIDTGIEKRDEHLRAPDVFDAAKYPDIAVEATKIRWKGKTFSGEARVTIRDKTRTVAFSGKQTGMRTLTMGGKKETRAGYKATAKIDRGDFGITFGAMSEGLSMIGETVSIILHVELVRAAD